MSFLELSALILVMTLNWIMAHSLPNAFFSITSFAIFCWGLFFAVRAEPIGTAIFAAIAITRASVMVSLIFIEFGGYIVELAQIGEPGEASAAYAFYSNIMILCYVYVFRNIKVLFSNGVRSDLIDFLNRYSRYAVVIAVSVSAFMLFYFGYKTGFPTLNAIDRFHFRANNANVFVGTMIIYKFLPIILLGVIEFSEKANLLLKIVSGGVMIFLFILYFLYGDKFFAMLESIAFFFIPYLIKNSSFIMDIAKRYWVVAVGSLGLAICMTLFIYSDYGTGNINVGFQRLQERMTEQAEVWYIETQDNPSVFGMDSVLLKRNFQYLLEKDPDTFLDKNGLGPQYFSFRFQTKADLAGREHMGGAITLTMAYEAMAVAIFGYVGAIGFMAASGAVFAVFSAYLYRAVLSEFWPSIMMATWGYMQMMSMSTQATFHQVLGIHSVTRWAIFLAFEAALFALNTSRRPRSPGAKGLKNLEASSLRTRRSGKAPAAGA